MKSIRSILNQPVPSSTLAFFRILFGALMTFSVLRFMALGWIDEHFVNTQFQFKYFGFEWVKLLPPLWMYLLHVLMLFSALGILLGWHYRLSALLFFLSFTYCELIDLTYYLNHYYFVSLVALLLIFVPAGNAWSLDVHQGRSAAFSSVPSWTLWSFRILLGLVYFCAGLAKMNAEWLIDALPLRIWIPSHDNIPVLGPLFAWKYSPWIFSWAGMIFDTCIFFFLVWKPTRIWAYAAVIVFHSLTGILFQIGIFPVVMIASTLIFFSASWHEKILQRILPYLESKDDKAKQSSPQWNLSRFKLALWLLFFTFQLLFPWRYLLYPGNLFWTEEGYRFGWRVMLMEKAGTTTFFVIDARNGRETQVNNADFLNPHQEKQMSFQPDMMLQFAHFLKRHFEQNGVRVDRIRAEAWVTLNGRPSALLIDPTADLTKISDSWAPKTWILPHPDGRNTRK